MIPMERNVKTNRVREDWTIAFFQSVFLYSQSISTSIKKLLQFNSGTVVLQPENLR